jgi:hypothetical protein
VQPRPRLTILTGGHPFDAAAFDDLCASLPGDVEQVPHPAADERIAAGPAAVGDVLVLYDMPGVGFRRDGPPHLPPPPEGLQRGWARIVEAGVPVLALHHALASWPAWPWFADLVGGRFHYVAAHLDGTAWPDSGYRHHVRQTLSVVAADHPVCLGLPPSFELVDETYLCPVFEHRVTPLLVTDAPRTDTEHYSATLAVTGRRDSNDGWHHPAGSALAAWTHRVGASPVVYVQPGDGPTAFGNEHYRALLANAVAWLAGSAR